MDAPVKRVQNNWDRRMPEKESNMFTAPLPPSDAMAAAVGMMTIEQAAALLPFNDRKNAILFCKRLIARLSLKAVQIGITSRVSTEALNSFISDGGQSSELRKAFGLPPETLEPIFPMNSSGNGQLFSAGPFESEMYFARQGIGKMMEQQLPKEIRVDPYAAQPGYIPASGFEVFTLPPIRDPYNNLKAPETITIPVTITPEMRQMFSMSLRGAVFKNVGEYMCLRRLHELAWREAMKAVNLVDYMAQTRTFSFSQGSDGDARPMDAQVSEMIAAQPAEPSKVYGIDQLYESSTAYTQIINAIIPAFASSAIFSVTRRVNGMQIIIILKGADLVAVSGTTLPRIACLAF